MRVIQLMRKPQAGFHSFERLFADIRAAMPGGISVRLVHSPFHSRGLVRRLLNGLHAATLRADVIHITGDIPALREAAGEGAVFPDPRDTVSIRSGFVRLLREPALRNTLVENGFANARRFQPPSIAAQYAAAYRDVG